VAGGPDSYPGKWFGDIDFTQTFPEGSFHLFGTETGFFTPAS
jgi:hypothetical protein